MACIFDQHSLDFISHSEAQTRRLGARLGELLQGGEIIALEGELGSGKTRWVQGVGQGLEIHQPITSPTFTLVNEYPGRLALYHIDLYRIDQVAEALAAAIAGSARKIAGCLASLAAAPPRSSAAPIAITRAAR